MIDAVHEVVESGCEQLIRGHLADQRVLILTIWTIARAEENVGDAMRQKISFEIVDTWPIVEVTSFSNERGRVVVI